VGPAFGEQSSASGHGAVGNEQTVLLLTALIIVAVILLLACRFPILWLPPLITIGKLG